MLVLRIPQEADLYNPYAPEGNLLNEEAFSMLKSVCNEMSKEQYKEKLLEIRCGAPIDEARAREAFRATFDQELEACDRRMKLNKALAFRQYVLGALLIILGMVLTALTNRLFLEFISILGGFAVENGAELQFVANSELRAERIMLEKIRTWDISFLV